MFLLWGVYYGVFLILERVTNHFPEKLLPAWLSHVYTIAVFSVGWLIFRSSSIDQFYSFLTGLFNFGPMTPQSFKFCIPFFTYKTYLTIFLALLLSTPLYKIIRDKVNTKYNNHHDLLSSLSYAWTAILLLICYMPLFGATYNAFIYFRF